MTTKLLPVKDAETDNVIGYRDIYKTEYSQNDAIAIVYVDKNSSPMTFSLSEYNALPDLSILENNNVIKDENREIYWLIK